jgi:adenylate cyclase
VGDGVNLAARIEGLTRDWGVPLLVADTTRSAAGELPGCAWVEVDEVAVKGRRQLVTLFVPLAVPPAAAAENPGFHEQLGLWRLAQQTLRGHHDDSSQAASTQLARTVARARLAELLEARPAVPELHALAAHRLVGLAAQDAARQSRDPASPPSASA